MIKPETRGSRVPGQLGVHRETISDKTIEKVVVTASLGGDQEESLAKRGLCIVFFFLCDKH